MPADMQCSVVDARAWTHRGRLACVAFLRGEELAAGADTDRVTRILARLGHLLRGDGEAPGAVAAVPAAGVAHADRRLHQLMAADLDRATSFPELSPAVSVQSWAERGYIRRADGSPIWSEAERERLNQCLQAAIERRSQKVNRVQLPLAISVLWRLGGIG